MDLQLYPASEAVAEPAVRGAMGLNIPPQPHGAVQQAGNDLFCVFERPPQSQPEPLQHQHQHQNLDRYEHSSYIPCSADAYASWSQDPMDLDYDSELASWVSSWDTPPPSNTQQQPHFIVSPAVSAHLSPTLSPKSQQEQEQCHDQRQTPQHFQQVQVQTSYWPHSHHHPQLQQQDQTFSEQRALHNQQQQHQPIQEQLQHQQQQEKLPGEQSSYVPVSITSLNHPRPIHFTEAELSDSSKMSRPDDFLFPDDETAVLSSQIITQNLQNQQQQKISVQHQQNFRDATMQEHPAPSSYLSQKYSLLPPGLDLNDPDILRLYDDMLLFSHGNHLSNDKLTFENCDASKEAVLYRLALKFKLSYSYEPVQRKANIWRPSVFSIRQEMTAIPTSMADAPPVTFSSQLSPNPKNNDGLQLVPQTTSPGKTGHTITMPMAFPFLQQDTNTVGLSVDIVGMTPPSIKRLSTDSSAATSVTFSHVLPSQSFDEENNAQDTPSLSDRLSNSWSIFHSGISSRRPRGRRGPLSAKSRKDIRDLEWAGGACWRCKILRRKCDSGIPCKNCPAPELREDAPPWPLIGCRRGNLRDAMPPEALCTKSRALLASCLQKMPAILAAENVVDNLTGGPPPVQPDVVSHCFREAEMQLFSDNKLVLDNPALFLRAHNNSVAAHHFSQSIRNGRYRANKSLNVTCQVHEGLSTYSDLVSRIAWELADNNESLNVLEIESVESFMMLLETACLYEVEVGKSPMVALSLVCLRSCLDALRLNAAHLLDARLHSTCQSDRCSIDCLRELASCIETYIEELSSFMFRKVNLRDRRWWLSTFYSLCIQAYVRRALLVIEQQLLYPDSDDVDALYSSQYLHLVTVLFTAVSFQYDPLVSTNDGLQLRQTSHIEEDGSSSDIYVPDRYLTAGRAACAVSIWLDEGIKSSYQFLTRLLNIGSLDFDMGQVDINRGDMAMEGSDAVLPLRRPHGIKAESFSAYSSPNSSTASFTSSLSAPRSITGVASPPSSVGPMSSTSSPRTSILVTERCSSISPLPSRLSATSLPLFNNSLPPKSGKPGSIVSENGSVGIVATATKEQQSGAIEQSSAAAVEELGGTLICTCCPKRPQHFHTPEELKLHQNKKPHICAFCGRRFSRMNEAERHITTIHLRPHSWSCRRLATPLSAFQRVSDGTESYDVCGFCGKQFRHTSDSADTVELGEYADKAQLLAHIEVDHKLHDCKASAKKFYREDMFGQHLKLSHAAESGLWLKYIENTCKAEEKEGLMSNNMRSVLTNSVTREVIGTLVETTMVEP
ncbi:hypothetical protein SEPCBS57363_004942 [Sporothrix epigloea]|uniref:C2H2-type domain-containing protein n=1 Tax=Sporothrix epigloea TaxID=1892477 RepID=A0ABP0DYR4_9PEZI